MIEKKFLSILMTSIIILSLSFGISIPIVLAGTSVVTSTDAKLFISNADAKVLRLLPNYVVNTSDLSFEASAKATTEVNNNGPATIEQKYVAWGERNGPTVSAGGVISNAFSATNAKEVKSNMSCETVVKNGKNVMYTSGGGSVSNAFSATNVTEANSNPSTEVVLKKGWNVVRTLVSGISLANIDQEQSDYEFWLSGSHVVKTNALPPGSGSFNEFEKIRISFEACPTETDIPADITQSTNLGYNIEDGVLNGYGFDYFNEAVANDITCSSSMNYRKEGGD
jgi:hypothetical protein